MGAAGTETSGAADRVRIVLRPIGVPLPLGLTALAIGSFLISARELVWVGAEGDLELGLILLGLVFPFQLVGALFGFLDRDPVAGTGAALAGGAWLATGIYLVVPGSDPSVYAVALLAIVISLVVPLASSWLSNRAVFLVFAATALRFALSAAYGLSDLTAIEKLAGGFGIVVAALSLYTALALELESMRSGPSLPLLRQRGGRLSVTGSFEEQVSGIEHEAGVRRRL